MKTIQIALQYYGIKELPGAAQNNPTIVSWTKWLLPWVKDDETSWCAAFTNHVAMEAGLEHFPKGFNSALAREWLNKGEVVTTPQLGDVVILWRGSKDAVTGHVGFFIKEDATNVWMLGGNQSDQVNILPFPKARVLGYRRLRPLK